MGRSLCAAYLRCHSGYVLKLYCVLIMGRQFNDLEKRVYAILANGGNPLTSSDEAVRRFWEWRTNPSNANHRLPTGSARAAGRKKSDRAIIPFTVELVAGTFAKVNITARTNTAAAGAIATSFGYQTPTAGQIAVKLGSFRPAQVYWRTGAATDSAPRTSRITGRPYKSYYAPGDEGYSASFGKTGTDTYTDRQRAIRTALGVNINLITFTSERYSG